MTKLQLKTHPVWQDLTEVLENLNTNYLVTEHLELCDYKICGYWDEQDEFYEQIILPRSLSAELVSSSIGVTGEKRWIKVKFILKADLLVAEDSTDRNYTQNLGELTIIYDENLQFVDENWQINMDYFVTRPEEKQK
ncbi:MAG: hypothetical protein EAZ78_24430 [Oscillatoriales cyanobacterium]|uniref:Uncharacterized protein n=1 Tax=Microcoleus anatoxicus PTRS2 TaxID=2705321 RepID=A0ABU8YIN5_9CYAN|nr:MAG: hypothetical protein EAZ98_18340 [Oscillatoriales cyanobacterium]TAE01945.1 MAG: hypothetical protein EAZ96_17440 [Oscillatoriales cyanobacterium]TAE98289.1 MAG: hypothetical protein EAZ78_24430 [Oscillatoriales cyanobacterium]TAF62946.1 MAG: hypothetical protein EAZ59_21995 [Oscillatoriales cyanobacterium]